MTYRSSKNFIGFPCAHRKWSHSGHCAWVHGYSRSFLVWFEAQTQEKKTGFVMDFGKLDHIKTWLEHMFDHTLLLDQNDPLLPEFKDLERKGACKITVLPDVSMEGTAKYVFEYVNEWTKKITNQRVWVHSVECRENEKNSAIYIQNK